MSLFAGLINDSVLILSNPKNNFEEKLNILCSLLQKKIKYYDWVGFYFSKFKSKTLELKAFAGSPTDHKIIPFGKGVCGEVAISNKTSIVPDVNSYENYISCNIDVKSEIVAPIFHKEINIGQIDIDSFTLDAFRKEDVLFLEKISRMVAKEIDRLENER
ncbi:MAG: GAF domain-containing protein [Bacteroidota bacterium]|nr:GAF domain-containing protein [Bacteroidota bacterium]